MKKILPRVGFAMILLYAGAAAYSEIGLTRLLKSPKPEKSDPRVYNGLQFPNSRELGIYVRDSFRNKYHAWTRPLEEWHCFFLLSVVAGGLGGISRDIKDLSSQTNAGKATGVFAGLIIGPILLLVSVLYPAVMTEGELQFRPAAIAAVCFLGGLFSDKAWKFVEAVATKTFKDSI